MKQEQIKEPVILYWWNMGRKTLDFKGTISEFLKEKGFKVSKIKHPNDKTVNGYRFKFALSSTYITADIFHSNLADASINAIKIFLQILGDKALITGYKYVRVNH